MNCPRHSLSALHLSGLLLLVMNVPTRAGSATWKASPATGDWNSAINWMPNTVPNGPSDTATFVTSNQTTVSLSAITELDGIVFDAGASAFTITAGASSILGSILTLSGAGITNNSGVAQNFMTAVCGCGGTSGLIKFTNSATAGTSTIFTNNAAITSGGVSGIVATLTANSGLNGGGGSTVLFSEDSKGGTARVKVFGNGQMYIATHNAPGVTIGSREGTGAVSLGANNLTVGSNNRSTTFSGIIQDGGSLTKVGTGKLVLTNANTYTGGTTISNGKLVVQNVSGSGTGSGAVEVNAGRLGGTGISAGSVTVGTGSGKEAFLAPGIAQDTAVLTLLNSLTFNADGGYRCGLNSDTASSDEVFASGVAINSGARFLSEDAGASALTPGIVLTVINNTAATPVIGTFSNLADGSILTVGSNTYLVSYEGGDGNDLTLTVVPQGTYNSINNYETTNPCPS